MKTILCFGDSNTHGTPPMATLEDDGRLDRDTRWPGRLGAALGAGVHIIEEGLPGRTTVHDDPIEGVDKNGERGLVMALQSHRPLDLVILMLGTNDLKARFSVGPVDIALSVEKLADQILTSDSGRKGGAPKLLVVAPPPILETGDLAEMFAGGAAKSKRLGAAMESRAALRGFDFVDAGQHIAVSPLDGIHYDADTHGTLAEALTEPVRGMLGL